MKVPYFMQWDQSWSQALRSPPTYDSVINQAWYCPLHVRFLFKPQKITNVWLLMNYTAQWHSVLISCPFCYRIVMSHRFGTIANTPPKEQFYEDTPQKYSKATNHWWGPSRTSSISAIYALHFIKRYIRSALLSTKHWVGMVRWSDHITLGLH